MLEKLTYIESNTTNPYHNLALEEALLFGCGKEECILYLWPVSYTHLDVYKRQVRDSLPLRTVQHQ